MLTHLVFDSLEAVIAWCAGYIKMQNYSPLDSKGIAMLWQDFGDEGIDFR